MTTKSGSSNISTRKQSGEYQAGPTASGVTANVTVSFDDTVILNRDQLLAAVHNIVDQLMPK
jgi:hypothetical protein